MISKKKSLPSKNLGKTRRSLRGRKGKRETNHPFFRNRPQGQPGFREPKKAEVGGKMPRQPPMECWGCKGNHRYRYFPHRNDKVRVFHNVQ
jgi:hypothetical protein